MNLKSHLMIVLLAALMAAGSVQAQNDNSQPLTLIGSSLSVHGEPYDWVEASDDGTYRTDTYVTGDLNYSVSVVTKLGHPGLASVTGSSPWTSTVDGHVSGGSYADNYSESGTPGYGSWEAWTYSVNFAANTLDWVHDSTSNDGAGNSSSSQNDSAGNWSQRTDSNDGLGSYTWSESWGMGTVTLGTRAGGTSYWPAPSGSVSVFGRTFAASSGESSWQTETASGVATVNYAVEQQTYTDADSSITVGTSSDTVSNTASTWISGWTPEIGIFSATLPAAGISDWSAVVWDARTAPSFAPDTLWVNGWLVSWQQGVLGSDGTVEDLYEDADGVLEVRITGAVRDFAAGDVPADVRIQGLVEGTVNNSGSFSVDEWTVQTTGTDESSSTPFFLPAAASLWVDGVQFEFAEGLVDDNGAHVDVYAAPAGAGTVRLAGNTVGAAHLAGNLHTTFFHGSLGSGVFTIEGNAAGVSDQEPLPGLPSGVWAGGRYYAANNMQPGLFSHSLGDDLGSMTLTVTVDQAGYTISSLSVNGTIPHGKGVEMMGGMPVMLCGVARTPEDITAVTGQPPAAVRVSGQLFPFARTIEEGSAALYLPAGDGPAWMWMTMDLTSHLVTLSYLADPGPLTVKTGSYDPTTYLFSTPKGENSLPEYVHALLPGSDHSHQRLPLPVGSDLPPSFIVRGQPWWFAGWNPTSKIATYRGFYEGQFMTVDNAVPVTGGRTDHLVTLVDRYHNGVDIDGNDISTQGTLSDVRRSVRLRDGTVVLTGNESGGSKTIDYEDDHSLYTIRSDLDLLGNNLSFGILKDDASLAGAAWRFEDRDSLAVLHSILSRSQAEWVWWKAGALPGRAHELQPVMQLDPANRLNLYPAAAGAALPAPGIILDPSASGASSFPGPVRVHPAGDIGMGDFHQGFRPDGSFDTGTP